MIVAVPVPAFTMAPPLWAVFPTKVESFTVNVPVPLIPLAMAPPAPPWTAETSLSTKVESVTVAVPEPASPLSIAPP